MLRRALRELSRRRVFRGAAVYVIVAWAALQFVDAGSDAHDPIRRLALMWAIGLFPLAVLFSWVFRVMPGVVHRESHGEAAPPRTALSLGIDLIAASGLLLIILIEVYQRFT